MMRYSVCVDALFDDKDLYESLDKLYRLGFKNFEFWSWGDKDIQMLADFIMQRVMSITAFCTKKVSLADSSKFNEYMDGLGQTLQIADKLSTKKIITQVGDELPGVPREKQQENIMHGLSQCVPMLEKAGVTLLVEPLNTLVDHMGYYLSSSAEAFGIIDEVGSSYVKVLFDIYHQQVSEGNILQNITQNIGSIGHFHAAGVPGRNELFAGELDYGYIFKSIGSLDYDGYIGLEYFPLSDAEAGLLSLPRLYQ
jgi:hydroxypyruvate isomerase